MNDEEFDELADKVWRDYLLRCRLEQQTTQAPQEATDLLNEHFWDLVD